MKFMGFVLFHLLMILSSDLEVDAWISNEEKNKILQDYYKYQPPLPLNASENWSVKVTFRLMHLLISLDYEEEAMSMTGAFQFMWVDRRLASKSKHSIVSLFSSIFSVNLDEIWSGVPSIAYNTGSKTLELGSGEKNRRNVMILDRGIVIGGSVLSFQSVKACRSDLTAWPFDVKVCDVHFISSAINRGRVQFNTTNYVTYGGRPIKNYVECKGWDVEKLSFNPVKNGSEIILNLHLKRNGARYAVYFHVPAFVNLLVSVSLFFLDPQSRERFILLFLLIIIQIYFLKSLSLLIPHYYNQRPIIVFFIEMSTVLVLIQFCLVIICRAMMSTEYNPSLLPKAVSMIVRSGTFTTFFLLDFEPKIATELLEEQEEEGSFLIERKNHIRRQWLVISSLIHRATFYFAFIFSLYLTYSII